MNRFWAFIDFVGRDPWYAYVLMIPIGALAFLSATMAILRGSFPGNPYILTIGIILLACMLLHNGFLIAWAIASMLRSVWGDPGESASSVCVQDSTETHHAKSAAITVFGIATGALGFGLFASNLQFSGISEAISDPSSVVLQLQLVALLFGVSFYFATLKSVQVVLTQDSVTWRDVAKRPLTGMAAVMVYLVGALVIGFFA